MCKIQNLWITESREAFERPIEGLQKTVKRL
jgi:hypothetical protein